MHPSVIDVKLAIGTVIGLRYPLEGSRWWVPYIALSCPLSRNVTGQFGDEGCFRHQVLVAAA